MVVSAGSDDERRTLGSVAGGLLVALVVYFGASLPSDLKYGQGDLLDYYLPQADQVGHALTAGYLPFWNPRVACGLDQVGSAQSGLFYPFTYVHGLLPVQTSLSGLVIFHLFVAALGFLRWMRSFGVAPLAAWLGAATFTFGLVAEAWCPPMLYTLAWGPWILSGVSMQGPLHRALTLTTLPVALQLLAGFPQYAVYTLLFAGAYTVMRGVVFRSWRSLGLLLAGTVVGAAIAAPQLATTMRYLQQCYRSTGPLSPEAVHYLDYSLDASKVQSDEWTTARHFLRTASRMSDNERPARPRSLGYRRDFGYLGVVVPLVLGFSLLTWRRWETWFLVGIGILGLYLSLGYLAGPVPAYGWLARFVPMFGAFRTPDRLNLWTLFAIAAMTAIGTDKLRETMVAGKPIRLKVLLILAGMVGLRCLASLTGSGNNWWALVGWATLALVLGVGLMACASQEVFTQRACRRGDAALIVVCIVALLDFVISARYVARWHEYPSKFYTSIHRDGSDEKVLVSMRELSALHSSLDSERLYVAARYLPIMMTNALPDVRTLPFYEPMTPSRHFELNKALMAARDGPPITVGFNYYDLPVSPHLKMFDWCSVRLIVSVERLTDPEQDGWKLVRQLDSGTWLYENEHAVPRAALFGAYRKGSADDAKQEMAATGFADRQQGPWLEEEPSSAWRNLLSAVKEPSGSLGEVTWLVDRPSHLALKVRCDRPAILVLSDSWFPGWRCEVDGQPTEILRANFIHRAVPLSAGEHEVVMDYSPVGMKAGLTVAGVVLSLLSGAVALQEFRLNRKRLSSNSIDPSWSQR